MRAAARSFVAPLSFVAARRDHSFGRRSKSGSGREKGEGPGLSDIVGEDSSEEHYAERSHFPWCLLFPWYMFTEHQVRARSSLLSRLLLPTETLHLAGTARAAAATGKEERGQDCLTSAGTF